MVTARGTSARRSGRRCGRTVGAVLAVGLILASCGSGRAIDSATGPAASDGSTATITTDEQVATTGPAATAVAPADPTTTSSTSSAPSAAPPTTSGANAAAGPGPLGALAGHTIVVDPGHDGADGQHLGQINAQVFIGNGSKACESTGTAGNDGYPEHAFTWDVANRLQAILAQNGAHVAMTRPSDDGWGPCITDRARIGNDAHAELGVSIHADGAPTTGRGFHVIRPLPVPGYNDGIVDPSNRFATILRDTFGSTTSMPTANYIAANGLISRSDLGGLNLSHVPKVFIECGNMRNVTDEAMLHDPTWQQQAAEAIAAAMNSYFATR